MVLACGGPRIEAVILTIAHSGQSAEIVIQRAPGALKSTGAATHPVAGVPIAMEMTLEETATANVPEPDTLALLGTVIAAFALIMLVRKRRGK